MSSSTEQVKGFDTEELINFLKGRNLHLNETHYNSLRHKEIAGSDFLNYTREELKGLGLAIGPTKRIEQLINELNTQSNDVLKKEVEGLDTEGLINFLKERQNLHLNETHYNIFRHKEITGSDFLNYTKEEFEGFGLASGPAKRIEQLVNELNNQIIFNLWTTAHGYGCVRGNKEDNRLVAVINRFGSRNWNRIARKMGNRNPIECQRRWNLINFNANRPSRNGTRSLHHRNTSSTRDDHKKILQRID
ncbi:uncharacterized protein OCT59_025007 [Rhizophagus irregularis]|uniref:uncharacterized protein n=1 Tax=Rhizophagus irregularis TaxID=588596 RepID=UPI0019EE4667|nr:hypothetical protein OCT59_025007 [Rhizophagus irregularis]GBC12088.2 hypothetical protein GLOIN_2v434100 [Rhizophagus irregularis DAOM 181602=DAOM 197198]